MVNSVKIIECPRDAMQGIHDIIETDIKAEYINMLLKVGFDTIDFGSFVSPKAVPQMQDTVKVLSKLDLQNTKSKLLAIVANVRGGSDAAAYEEITYLGFPFSVSQTFQQRNTNSTIEQSLSTVQELQNICLKNKKQLVVYLSMAFGNPYGDKWNSDIVTNWFNKMMGLEIKTISLADTVGMAKPDDIRYILTSLIPAYPFVEVGVHLHCKPNDWKEKLNAAWQSGCRRIDTAIKGYGGCPMAADDLTGNLATENLIQYLKEQNVSLSLDVEKFQSAMNFSDKVFAFV